MSVPAVSLNTIYNAICRPLSKNVGINLPWARIYTLMYYSDFMTPKKGQLRTSAIIKAVALKYSCLYH